MINKIIKHKKIIFIVLFLVLIAVVYLSLPEITAEAIMSYTPQNLVAATLFMMLVYFIKSLIFPLIAVPIQVATGYLFPLPLAIFISLAGATMTMVIQYGMGFYAGAEFADKLVAKYPKANDILSLQKEHAFFLCFFLRFFTVIPGSAANMYFGATRMRFVSCIAAGFIGVFPSTVLATIIEPWLENFYSPQYWILAGSMIIMLAVFAMLGIKFRKKL